MLITELFYSPTESDTGAPRSNPVLQIPLKFISITPESHASLTPKHQKKIIVLANTLKKRVFKPVPPIKVRKINGGFVLVYGLLRLLAYKKAGMYSIPAEVLPETVSEDRQRWIIYINDKPSAYYQNKADADEHADVVKKRVPSANVEVKQGMVST